MVGTPCCGYNVLCEKDIRTVQCRQALGKLRIMGLCLNTYLMQQKVSIVSQFCTSNSSWKIYYETGEFLTV